MNDAQTRTVPVAAGRPYQVHIGRGLLARAGAYCREVLRAQTLALIADETAYGFYGEAVVQSLTRAGFRMAVYRFTPGEGAKSLDTAGEILEFLAAEGLTRSDALVALGGGVAGDLTGFCAAVYLRGVDFVQLPTTFLAAIDSSVGGKTGVNLRAGKNLAGAFHQPALVLCDCGTFVTLPPAVFADGTAEAVKYGMLADAGLFSRLAGGVAAADLPGIVADCVAIKARLVAEDEFDRGQRQLLNFGHTVGHALEAVSGFALSHGHAVAAGMAIMARAAHRLGLSAENTAPPLENALKRHNLPISSDLDPSAVLKVMGSDKKRAGDRITLVLPERVGRCMLHPVVVDALPGILAAGWEVS